MGLDPADIAENVRQAVWEGRGFPVDPVTVARDLGVTVLETDLPDGVSGALIKEAGKDPVIVLHSSDSWNRKRFTCAHELGHYMERVESDDKATEYDYVDLRDSSSASGTCPHERFANAFAAALLMPEAVVLSLHRAGKSHMQMAMYFGVSNEALKNRLSTLHLI